MWGLVWFHVVFGADEDVGTCVVRGMELRQCAYPGSWQRGKCSPQTLKVTIFKIQMS